ncbi:MAG: hypothetical protein JW869_04980 [Candidatus Omnitrophica bacterium]|nr:hypothetical protein [Candidatus Omnitrophota bacterium]
MKAIINGAIAAAGISLVVGIISRMTLKPIGPSSIEAQAFLQFTNTCLLLAIALTLLEILKSKS